MGVLEVRCESGGNEPAGKYTFSMENRNENNKLCTGFSVHTKTMTAVKRVELGNDRLSYRVLKGL
jgi:hypothetical protein